jgi:hypothetical protein
VFVSCSLNSVRNPDFFSHQDEINLSFFINDIEMHIKLSCYCVPIADTFLNNKLHKLTELPPNILFSAINTRSPQDFSILIFNCILQRGMNHVSREPYVI